MSSSMGYLQESGNGSGNILLDDGRFKDRDFVLLDESHNFRYPDTQRYKLLQAYLSTGSRRTCFVTATPRNKSAWDVYYQIKLFHQNDKTDLPVDPADLKQYFKLIEGGAKKLPDLLSHVLIRRTRNHILRWYGYDAQSHERIDPSRYREYLDGRKWAYVMVAGKHQFFPKRELETIEYSIEDTYQGLYQELRGYLGKPRTTIPDPLPPELTYARYGLWRYVQKDKQKREPYASLARAGSNLRGLIRVLLFKRFESSVYAFQETVRRLLGIHETFLRALDHGVVPAGEDAQKILYESDFDEEADLISALRDVSNRYNAADFNLTRLRQHIEHDIAILQRIQSLVEPIKPKQDAKLLTLIRRLKEEPLKSGKRLIFTQYADTARYLYENLKAHTVQSELEVIFSGDKSKMRVVGRFAPMANPQYKLQPGETELNTVVATDVLSEGLNLQDCDKIINYDLHWNPVRLIQRFGRIDRIGSDHDVVYGFNFLPETGIERNLGLRQRLHNRIQEIHDTIGEDSAILDRTEQLNEEAMYAIYEKKGGNLSLFEDEEEEFVDLNEAEEILRLLRKDNPAEYDRIASLRDGIRAAKPNSARKGLYVFCQAERYQQLFLLDQAGELVSRDIPKVLGAIKCSPELKGEPLPADYNSAVMRVKRQFAEEVKHREAEREHTVSLTHGQRYVLRELRVLFGRIEDEDMKSQINVLEKAYRAANLTSAVKKELNLIRRNGLVGDSLLKGLIRIYNQHNIREWLDRQRDTSEPLVPKIVCSEALI